MYKIVVDHAVKDEDEKIILEELLRATEKVLGNLDFMEKPFSVLLKDGNQKIHGGIMAGYDSESIYINALWVDEKLRHRGYGTKLLRAAEDEARKLSCRYSTLDTWSFQAEEFYLKNGYERIGEIKNYYLHYSKIFLRKIIISPLSAH